MKGFFKNKIVRNRFKRTLAVILVLIITLTSVNFNSFMKAKAAEYKTLYFIDNTAEQWVKNDSAVMELVDNTNGHDSYWMTQMNDATWCVNVPESAYNITFNRYSSDKTTKWNSWSAGGRDENNAYYADGAEYGHWDVVEEGENYFHAGDIIYLDLSEFPEWENDDALMYVNFTDASKEENGGNDVSISNADKNVYNPKLTNVQLMDSIYAYVVTYEDEGASELRFWRGNELTLWNYSVALSYEDYLNGKNCIKVIGWNDSGSLEISEYSIDFELDSDQDGIPDYYEIVYGLNKNSKDSDNDGLEDAYELYFTQTNPLKYDSLVEGISDANVDKDGDGLTNAEEISLELNPCNSDTDGVGLADGDEINIHGTNPNNIDTDGDTLSDSDDMALSFSPLLEDTDGNGILDCDEKIYQNIEVEIDNSEKTEVKKVSVSFEGTGYINSTTSIEDLYGKDIYVSQTVGLVGVPVEITSFSEFDTASICFYLDEEVDKETLSNLIIMWYDEENDRFIEQETVIDEENMTASAKVNHFSKYMLVDYRKWFDAWKEEISYSNSINYDVMVVIDCSGSMSGNDPYFNYTYKNTEYIGSEKTVYTCYRKLAAENFISAQGEGDRTGIILFSSGARLVCPLTNTKSDAITALNNINSSGGTNFNDAISKSVNVLIESESNSKKMILFMSDGQASISDSVLNYAIENKIVINTVYMGSTSDNELLKNIAEKTGGEYFKAVTAGELISIYSTIAINQSIDTTDEDKDGIYDVFEKNGIRLSNGEILDLDPTNPDTDGDGLLDGDEINGTPTLWTNTFYDTSGEVINVPSYILKQNSNPKDVDSDRDGLLDGSATSINGRIIAPKDPEPTIYNGPQGIWKAHIAQNNSVACSLVSWQKVKVDWKELDAKYGSYFLNFLYDEKRMAIHSQVKTWQWDWGYNDAYDVVFSVGTIGNMESLPVRFNCKGKEYVIWLWKGDYLNLGGGAEIGIYQNPHQVGISNSPFSVEHWNAVNFVLPMKLYLYNRNAQSIVRIFGWEPKEEQWWITGFRPEFDNPNVHKMTSIGVINFEKRKEMYQALKSAVNSQGLGQYFIFDEDGHTVWIIWD